MAATSSSVASRNFTRPATRGRASFLQPTEAVHEGLDRARGRAMVLPLAVEQSKTCPELGVQCRGRIPGDFQAAAPGGTLGREARDDDVPSWSDCPPDLLHVARAISRIEQEMED